MSAPKDLATILREQDKTLAFWRGIHDAALTLTDYNTDKVKVNELTSLVLPLGFWVSAAVRKCPKRDLVQKLKEISSRMCAEYTEHVNKTKELLEMQLNKQRAFGKSAAGVLSVAQDNETAILIGKQEPFKDCAYHIYKVYNRYIAAIEAQDGWVSAAEFITESDITKYI